MSFHQKRIKLLLTEKESDLISYVLTNKQMDYQEDGDTENLKLASRIQLKITNAEYKAKQ